MRTLFLDLASHASSPGEGACIACVGEEKTASIRFADHRIGDDGLLPLLDDVLREAGWTEKDIARIACVTGPGGFTSLRMGVTLANVLADQLRIPLAGVHLSEVYAARADDRRSPPASFIWLHATKKKELFVRGFGDYMPLWPEPVLIPLDDLVAAYPRNAPYVGEVLPDQLAALQPSPLPLAPLADALPAILQRCTYADQPIAPWYGRGW